MSDVKNKIIIKDDKNFLEYPNWVVDEHTKRKKITMQRSNGTYVAWTSESLPNFFDQSVKTFLLNKLLNESEVDFWVSTTRFKTAKGIRPNSSFKPSMDVYKRILKALDKWMAIELRFQGVFYENGAHVHKAFRILSEYELNVDTGELRVKFDESYVTQIRKSRNYALIDYEDYMNFKSPLARRLYEILIKSFNESNSWHITIINLAEKLTLQKRKGANNYYVSDILTALRSPIKELSNKRLPNKGWFRASFSFDEKTKTCVFTKLTDNVLSASVDGKDNESFVYELSDQGVSITRARKLIKDYSIEKIKHKLDLLKGSKKPIRNTTAWLTKALQGDWQDLNAGKNSVRIKGATRQPKVSQENIYIDLKAAHNEFKTNKALEIFNALPEQLQELFNNEFEVWSKQYAVNATNKDELRISFFIDKLVSKDDKDFKKWSAIHGNINTGTQGLMAT